MEDVKEYLKKKDGKAIIKLSIFLAVLLTLFEIALCFWNEAFVIMIWAPILPFIYMLKRKIFFKKAEFCYGKVVDVTLNNDNDNDDVCMYTKIEFKDCHSNKIHEAVVYEHWGDLDIDEYRDEIDEFYEGGKKRIGKKVPLFYKKENPNKNIIFLNDLED